MFTVIFSPQASELYLWRKELIKKNLLLPPQSNSDVFKVGFKWFMGYIKDKLNYLL